ncbi:MAG TPA: DNA helicase, partial [Clostridiaceae bacterium]|nr:DNA helicase [Clostridiaceae bacterium]
SGINLVVTEFVKYLATQIRSIEPFRIGLIAPYRAQADLIDKLRTSVVLPSDISFQVDTIHGFQGDECELIIALFNPPPRISDSEQMFLNRLNIINVSISRARDYLCLIMPDDETENIENLRLIKRVEDLCKGQPGWVEHQAQDLEKLMFGNPNYLEENSFATSHQLVNVYGRPEKRYEVRSETSAVDVQVFGGKGMW